MTKLPSIHVDITITNNNKRIGFSRVSISVHLLESIGTSLSKYIRYVYTLVPWASQHYMLLIIDFWSRTPVILVCLLQTLEKIHLWRDSNQAPDSSEHCQSDQKSIINISSLSFKNIHNNNCMLLLSDIFMKSIVLFITLQMSDVEV